MEYVRVGRSNLKISRIILGNAYVSKAKFSKVLDFAVENGVNTFDTSNNYLDGESMLGLGLRHLPRERYILCTKFTSPRKEKPLKVISPISSNSFGWSRKHIITTLEQSLRMLKTDYVDIFQIHHPILEENWNEVVDTLYTLRFQGKIRYAGLSNFFPREARYIKKIGPDTDLFISNQIQINALKGINPSHCKKYRSLGLSVLGYAPLAEGILSGKYHTAIDNALDSNTSTPFRLKGKAPYFVNDLNNPILEKAIIEFVSYARELSTPSSSLALRYAYGANLVDAVILGASSLQQIKLNLQGINIRLTQQQRERVNEIFAPLSGNKIKQFCLDNLLYRIPWKP